MDGGVDAALAYRKEGEGQEPELPDYLVDTYSWAYLRPRSIAFLDNPLIVSSILWGNFRRLVRTACAEFHPGQSILQAASVYGSLSADLARTVGRHGRLEVIDIAPQQVENCERKLVGLPQARARLADAAAPGGGPYDAVCCFFLLHEIPDDYKHAVVDALLDSVPPGGKVVFVDYHKTVALHPLRGVMHLVFRYLEPFAFGLVNGEIKDFASRADDFAWQKQPYFGGLYQKVVARRIEPALAFAHAAE